MGNLADLVRSLYDLAGVALPPWALVLAAVVALALLVPVIRRNAATDAARRAFSRAQRERGEARDRAEQAALARVHGNPVGLVVVADLALAAGRTAVATEALARLRALRRLPADTLRIQRALDGPQPTTALEAAMVVERLLDQGQEVLARQRLLRAMERWPGDEDLLAQAARLHRDDS